MGLWLVLQSLPLNANKTKVSTEHIPLLTPPFNPN